MTKRLTSTIPKHFLKYVFTVSNTLTEEILAEQIQQCFRGISFCDFAPKFPKVFLIRTNRKNKFREFFLV